MSCCVLEFIDLVSCSVLSMPLGDHPRTFLGAGCRSVGHHLFAAFNDYLDRCMAPPTTGQPPQDAGPRQRIHKGCDSEPWPMRSQKIAQTTVQAAQSQCKPHKAQFETERHFERDVEGPAEQSFFECAAEQCFPGQIPKARPSTVLEGSAEQRFQRLSLKSSSLPGGQVERSIQYLMPHRAFVKRCSIFVPFKVRWKFIADRTETNTKHFEHFSEMGTANR